MRTRAARPHGFDPSRPRGPALSEAPWYPLYAGIRRQGHDAEVRYGWEPADRLTAEQIFERRWTLTMVERTLVRLRQESVETKTTQRFEVVKSHLTGEEPHLLIGHEGAIDFLAISPDLRWVASTGETTPSSAGRCRISRGQGFTRCPMTSSSPSSSL